jgi:hypothetical protein
MEDETTPRGWAVPGSAEEQPSPAPPPPPPPGAGPGNGAAPGGAGTTGGRAAGEAGPTGWAAPAGPAVDVGPHGAAAVPRVALRPMTVADVLDGGFAIVKARPRRILAIAAAFVVPTQLLIAWLQRSASDTLVVGDLFTDDPTVINEQLGNDGTGEVLALVLVAIIPAIALVCVAAAIAHLVGQWMMGRDAPAGEMMGVVGRRLWPLLASFVLVKVAEAVGIVGCYVGLVFIMALFVPVAPIIGVEGSGPIAAMRRSVRLVRPRYFPVLGIALLMGVTSLVLATALSALPQSLAGIIGYENGWPLLALGAIAADIVVLPWVAAATALLYFDLRVRTEGLDLEMSAIELFDRAA